MAATELNQFSPEAVPGQLALTNGNVPNILNVMLYEESDTNLKAGNSVAFYENLPLGEKSRVPLVQMASQISGAMYPQIGVVIHSQKKNEYKPGDMLEIAINGTIIYCKARGDIRRGETVAILRDGFAWSNNDYPVGTAIDNATDGEMFRIIVRGIA